MTRTLLMCIIVIMMTGCATKTDTVEAKPNWIMIDGQLHGFQHGDKFYEAPVTKTECDLKYF